MFKKDHSELLFYILRQLAQDQLSFQRSTSEMEALTIEIDEKDLLDKVSLFAYLVSRYLCQMFFRPNKSIFTMSSPSTAAKYSNLITLFMMPGEKSSYTLYQKQFPQKTKTLGLIYFKHIFVYILW